MASRAGTGTDGRVAAQAAAIASLGAAVIHFAVTPAHWRDWLPSGIFFAAIAVFQLVWAVLAWKRPPSMVLAAGIMVNAGIVALWVWSRTAGEPFGPNAGETEAVHGAGICVLLLECYIVMGAAWAWLRNGDRAEQVSGFGGALVLLGANSVVAVAVTVGLASGLQGHDHHHAPIATNADQQAPAIEHPAEHHDHSKMVTPMDARVSQPAIDGHH